MNNETDLDWLVRVTGGAIEPWCEFIARSGMDSWACTRVFDLERHWFTREQYLARRAELQNKPSWKDAPEWGEWLAQDKSGAWWFFRRHPKAMSEVWDCDDSAYHHSSWVDGEALGDWRDTLEKRPEEFQPFTSIEDNQEKDMKQDNGWFERRELPPVGVECIFEPASGACYFNDYELKASGKVVKVIAHTRYKHSSCDVAVFRWDLDGFFGVSTGNSSAFLPIRTERDELIGIIASNLSGTTGQVADAILAAGFKIDAK